MKKHIMFAKLRSVVRPVLKPLAKYLQEREYEGDNVVCVICGSKFKAFVPHGIVRRKNARCLGCGSLERHRLQWKYLNEKTNFPEWDNINLLHFAPETVFHKKFSALPNINYVPCDLTPEKYRHEGGVKLNRVDITSIPFQDNYFDVILCSHVLEHVPDDQLAMTELRRVMKLDGWGIFQVPIDYMLKVTYEDSSITTPEGRLKAFGQSDHVRIYGKDYKDRLAKAGFLVHEDRYIETFSKEELFKYGFTSNELIYFCQKKQN